MLLAAIIGGIVVWVAITLFGPTPTQTTSTRRVLDESWKRPTEAKQQIVDRRIALLQASDYRSTAEAVTVPEEYRAMAELKRNIENDLLARANIVGVGVRKRIVDGNPTDDIVLSIFVTDDSTGDDLRADPGLRGMLPDSSFLQVVKTGEIRARNWAPPPGGAANQIVPVLNWLNERVRPVFGGVSISRDQTPSGTLATCCYEVDTLPTMPTKYYMLSNNHVLANLNDSMVGDVILQPGWSDGGAYPADYVGWLAASVPIEFMNGGAYIPTNYVDAAIGAGHFMELDNRIYWTGNLRGVIYAPQQWTEVHKTGAVSAFTRGRITDVTTTIDVKYLGGKEARFVDQIVLDKMSIGGDSGSLVVDSQSRRGVGLLFADSIEDNQSYANKLLHIENALGIRISETGEVSPAPIGPFLG